MPVLFAYALTTSRMMGPTRMLCAEDTCEA
jgi:hypothetical protein